MTKMRAVTPVRTPAPWVGGKRQLARELVSIIEGIEHELYIEPFVGMGGVFFRRRLAPPAEVINDFSGDVANLFRILQVHYEAFMDMLKWQLTSREEFERLAGMDGSRLTDLQRAARFLYIQRTGFGGKVATRTFGIQVGPARFDIGRLGEVLAEIHARLSGVWIECLPWQTLIERWDRPGALFYLDPPYYGTEHYYGRDMFDRSQFALLAVALKRLQGRFVMTINDCAETRELFGDWVLATRDVSYTVGGARKAVRQGELIVSG